MNLRQRNSGASADADLPLRSAGRDARGTPEHVAAAIVRRILQRRYKPGERITEIEVGKAFEVGRSTVREAVRILSASGVIEATRHRGAAICVLTEADCRDLLDVIEVLLGLAARSAARNIEFGDNRPRLNRVAQVLGQRHIARDLRNVLEERLDFYAVMLSIAANRELDRALPAARAQIFRAQFYEHLTDDDLRAMISEYRGIAAAILEGDERKAERRMREHVARTGDRLMPRVFKHWRKSA
ncbi:MAG: GntR family transcriptional regulator [Burkholderiales bacterium]|nr:GntR family transcriptional regulator [Burkholderiales bacterium]